MNIPASKMRHFLRDTEPLPPMIHPPREPSTWGFIIKVLAVMLILGLAGIVLPL